jgi:putative glutamine amidotransferase
MTMSHRPKPVVLVPACNRPLGEHPFHVVGKKYVDAVRLAGALPLIVPTAQPEDLDALLDLADGVLLTGSASNVHPSHFDEDVHDTTLPLDPARDAWTLPLIPRVLARAMPLFAICRGTQEANVALGGSLHQAVQEVDPYDDHRAPSGEPAAVQYGPAHDVEVVPGGLLSQIVEPRRFAVNSVHGQAVNRLAPGLRAVAPGVAGRRQPGLDADAAGFRRRLPHLP